MVLTRRTQPQLSIPSVTAIKNVVKRLPKKQKKKVIKKIAQVAKVSQAKVAEVIIPDYDKDYNELVSKNNQTFYDQFADGMSEHVQYKGDPSKLNHKRIAIMLRKQKRKQENEVLKMMHQKIREAKKEANKNLVSIHTSTQRNLKKLVKQWHHLKYKRKALS